MVKSNFQSCCQQGVIPLNYSHSDDRIGEPGERRYLIFGGVHGDFTDQTFIFTENLTDISKSYTESLPSHTEGLPFADKFYY